MDKATVKKLVESIFDEDNILTGNYIISEYNRIKKIMKIKHVEPSEIFENQVNFTNKLTLEESEFKRLINQKDIILDNGKIEIRKYNQRSIYSNYSIGIKLLKDVNINGVTREFEKAFLYITEPYGTLGSSELRQFYHNESGEQIKYESFECYHNKTTAHKYEIVSDKDNTTEHIIFKLGYGVDKLDIKIREGKNTFSLYTQSIKNRLIINALSDAGYKRVVIDIPDRSGFINPAKLVLNEKLINRSANKFRGNVLCL